LLAPEKKVVKNACLHEAVFSLCSLATLAKYARQGVLWLMERAGKKNGNNRESLNLGLMKICLIKN